MTCWQGMFSIPTRTKCWQSATGQESTLTSFTIELQNRTSWQANKYFPLITTLAAAMLHEEVWLFRSWLLRYFTPPNYMTMFWFQSGFWDSSATTDDFFSICYSSLISRCKNRWPHLGVKIDDLLKKACYSSACLWINFIPFTHLVSHMVF